MTTIEQDINELLARLSACVTLPEYEPLRSRCVQALDSYEYGVGVGPNREGQWVRFERIDAEKRAMFRTMSVAELCGDKPVNLLEAMQAHRALAASQSTILGIVCGALAASTSLESGVEGSDHRQAAE